MKAYNAIYQHGFLYNAATGKRILLAEGSEFTITIELTDVLEKDPYNQPTVPLTHDQRINALRRKGYLEGIVIKPKGAELHFEISAGIKSKKKESKVCLFSVELEEDLLAVRKDVTKPYDLVECICTVNACLTNNLSLFEPIYAYSLNDAYMKTYDFYFRLYGKPSANIKTRMMEPGRRDKFFLKNTLNPGKKSDFKLY